MLPAVNFKDKQKASNSQGTEVGGGLKRTKSAIYFKLERDHFVTQVIIMIASAQWRGLDWVTREVASSPTFISFHSLPQTGAVVFSVLHLVLFFLFCLRSSGLSHSIPKKGWRTSWLVCVGPAQKIHSLCGFMAALAIALSS